MYGAMHPKGDVQNIYEKEGRRSWPYQCGTMRKRRRNSLGFYAANSEELLIRGVSASGTIQTEGTMEKEEFKRRKQEELKQKWTGRQCIGNSLEKCQ